MEQYNNYKTFLDGLASVSEKEELEKALAQKQATMKDSNQQKRGNKRNNQKAYNNEE